MLNWKHWCRICGSFEADEKVEQDVLQVVELIFQIETANSIHICLDCHIYIQDFQRFLTKVQNVNEMFLDLEQKDEVETVDEDLALQIRVYYDLSVPKIYVKNELTEDTEMADDLAEIENFILEDNSVDQDNTEYILEDDELESDHEENLQTEIIEMVEDEVQESVSEELVESFDNIIYEEMDSSNNEISDNEQFSEDRGQVDSVVEDISKHFEFRCHVCDKTFHKMHFLTTHTKIEHDCTPRVACPCGKIVGSTKSLQIHYRNHVLCTANFKCNHCHKTYKTETNFNNHMMSRHGDSFERLYQCNCGKAFKEARHLAVHANTHLPDDQKFVHECTQCEKRYSSVFSLRQHVKHVHIKNPTFKCQLCEKVFSRKANLESHVNHVHTTERNFECEICGLRLKTKGILRMHKKIHSTNPEDLLSCEVCKRQFKTQNQLTNHKVSHSKEKRYKCSLCSSQYKRSKELMSHIASTHTGESKYTCNWCSKTFYNNSNYRKHKLKMHPEEIQAQEMKDKIVDDSGFDF